MESKMTDESIMPWGKFKGQKLANIPASYFMWLYENKKANGEVLKYINDNLECLRTEVKSFIDKHS